MPYINDENPAGAHPGVPTPAQQQPQMTISGRVQSFAPGSSPAPVAAAQASGQTTVTAAHLAMTAAQKAHQQHLEELQRRETKFSPEGYADEVATFAKTPEAKAVEQHAAAVVERRNQAAADYDRTLAELSPAGDAAQETRNSRTWERHRRAIDSAKSPVAAARVAINQADAAELAVLLEEVPAHLAATGAPTDWINGAVEQRAPKLAAARTAFDKANQAVTATQYNAARLQEGFATGRPPVTLVDPTRFDPDR
jgi:hypothetical protein